jgi:hypothetical protein
MEDGIENNRTTIYDDLNKKETLSSKTELYICEHENGLIKDSIITINKTVAQGYLNKKYNVSIFIEDSVNLYKFSSKLNN